MDKIVDNIGLRAILKFEDILAFILGFATKMPGLSQKIHPLDVKISLLWLPSLNIMPHTASGTPLPRILSRLKRSCRYLWTLQRMP